jgi:hypothetical protein
MLFQLATIDFAFDRNLSEAAHEQLRQAVGQKLGALEENTLSQAANTSFSETRNVTFVSLHVRRTDYEGWLSKKVKGQLVSRKYFRCKFHQHFTCIHFVQKLRAKIFLYLDFKLEICFSARILLQMCSYYIFRAAFAQIILGQKSTNLKCKY